MATTTVIELGTGYISYPGRSICVTPDGAIYVIYASDLVTPGLQDNLNVMKSTDQGATWTSFLSLTGGTAYDSTQILSDSVGNLHLFYTLRVGQTYTIVHRSWISGTGFSAAHTVGTTNATICAAVVDTDDRLHCVYMAVDVTFVLKYSHSIDYGANWTSYGTIDTDTGSVAAHDVCLGIDTGSNLHAAWRFRGNYGAGSPSNSNIRYLTKTYADYGVNAWTAEWATAYDSVSPADTRPHSIVVNSLGEVLILFGRGGAACAVRAVGGGWSGESIGGSSLNSGDLVIDAAGRLYAIVAINSDRDYIWRERTATNTWSSPTTIAADLGASAYYRIDSLYAVFPIIGGVSPSIPVSGFASILISASLASVDFYNNTTFAMTVFPSDTRTRVAGLIHRYKAGVYNLEILLGDVRAEWAMDDYAYTSKKEDLEYYRWKNLAYQDDYLREEEQPYPYRPWGREQVRPPTPGGDWSVPGGVTGQPDFPVIQPEWAQGATPEELSGIFRTAEELRYGMNVGSIEDHLQKAREAEERAKQIAKTGISQKTYAGKAAPGKPPVIKSPTVPKCPAGQTPRFINGKWQCISVTGKFGGY